MNSKIQEKILIPFLAVCLFIPATSYAWTESTDYGFLSSAYNSTMEFFFGDPESSSASDDDYDYSDSSEEAENGEVGDVNGTATTEYTMPDGTQITVNNRAVAFKIAQKKKQLMVNTLSADQFKEAVLEAYDMTPEDLQELSDAITDGLSYNDMSAEEVAALNAAYVATTRQAVEDGEDLNQSVDFANIADIFSTTKLTPDQAIFAGASGLLALGGGAGVAAAASALKKRVGRTSSALMLRVMVQQHMFVLRRFPPICLTQISLRCRLSNDLSPILMVLGLGRRLRTWQERLSLAQSAGMSIPS